MTRNVQPEWLDELPPADPQAIGSRRDLQRLNFWMGHRRIIQRQLVNFFRKQAPRRMVELGAGDGTLMLGLAQKLSVQWPNVEIIFVDRQNLVSEKTCGAFQDLGWKTQIITTDVFEWLARGEKTDGIVANLFLHHFAPEKLAELFRGAARQTTFFLACEPRRSPPALFASRSLRLLGCNAVTRHDAVVSVRAGFADDELSQIWPGDASWQLREKQTGLFSHLFVAQKSEQPNSTKPAATNLNSKFQI